MPDQDQFGPRLRREREKRRIELEEIAAVTNVGVDLWEGLERNDFSRWPSGIFARAFVRDYARVVGLDPDAVVDEFCRHFSIGDRRASRIVRAQGDVIGHAVDWPEGSDPLPAGRDRRRRSRDVVTPISAHSAVRPRIIAAAIDAGALALVGAAGASALPIGFWSAAGAGAFLCFTASTLLTGGTPGSWALVKLRHRTPGLVAGRTVNA